MVMQVIRYLAVGVCVAAGCAPLPPERQLVSEAAGAMGGADRIQNVKTLVIEGEGQNFNLGQNQRPDGDLPLFKVISVKRSIDFAGGRWRQEQMREPAFPSGNPAPQRQVTALDGDVAFNVPPTGAPTRAVGRVAGDRRDELQHHPIGILRTALAEGATVGNRRQEGANEAVDVTTPDGRRFTLFVDSATKLPSKVASTTYHTNLGDVTVETDFGDYQDVADLKLPTTIVSRVDRYTLADIRVTRNTIDADVGDLAAPADVRSASPEAAAPTVTAEEVAPGIWYLAGQSHHSVLVEFKDHLALIEAPQNETRTLAVIAKARELRPNKPLKYVVNSHHHFDHSGGVRAAVAEGLTVVTHELNKPFFEEVVARQHTIVQDALAKNPKPLALETVADSRVLRDETRAVELYPIEGSAHADTLLMIYFPNERLLAEADVYSPPAPTATTMPAFPFAANLVENIQKRKLRVDRVLPLHGRVVPFRDLLAAAGTRPRTTTN
jgi:glyoxylase-like metal-dependent hydrolase (beta-lactamase superfamily II)